MKYLLPYFEMLEFNILFAMYLNTGCLMEGPPDVSLMPSTALGCPLPVTG